MPSLVPMRSTPSLELTGDAVHEQGAHWRVLCMDRERAAKMYARASYITAVGVVELPYLVAQTLVFVPISYFMIGKRPVSPHMPSLTSWGFDALSCFASLLAGASWWSNPSREYCQLILHDG